MKKPLFDMCFYYTRGRETSSRHVFLQRRKWCKRRGTTDLAIKERREQERLSKQRRRERQKLEQQKKPLLITPTGISATGITPTVITPTVIPSITRRPVEAPLLIDPSEISPTEICQNPPMDTLTDFAQAENVPTEIPAALVNAAMIAPTTMPQPMVGTSSFLAKATCLASRGENEIRGQP